MKNMIDNKFFAWLIGLLVLANVATIIIFWVGRMHQKRDASPREFLAAKLHFSEDQKKQYFDLANEHHRNAQKIRERIKASKDAFFDLIKNPVFSDSVERAAARNSSIQIEELDLYTLEHFKKVRALCTLEQKYYLTNSFTKSLAKSMNPKAHHRQISINNPYFPIPHNNIYL